MTLEIFMPKLQHEQGSPEWLEWRKTGIGASNMSVIMGSLPFDYEDILMLWKEKVGLGGREFKVSEAVQAGMDLEPEARECLANHLGIELEPQCFTHPEHPWLRASLDAYGIDKHGKEVIAEIKCPQVTSYKKAARGKILDYYYTQVQQQIACAETDGSYYFVYRPGEKPVLFWVPRNDTYINELIRRGKIFWEHVEAQKPVLPYMLDIDMYSGKFSDPFMCDGMEWEMIETKLAKVQKFIKDPEEAIAMVKLYGE